MMLYYLSPTAQQTILQELVNGHASVPRQFSRLRTRIHWHFTKLIPHRHLSPIRHHSDGENTACLQNFLFRWVGDDMVWDDLLLRRRRYLTNIPCCISIMKRCGTSTSLYLHHCRTSCTYHIPHRYSCIHQGQTRSQQTELETPPSLCSTSTNTSTHILVVVVVQFNATAGNDASNMQWDRNVNAASAKRSTGGHETRKMCPEHILGYETFWLPCS